MKTPSRLLIACALPLALSLCFAVSAASAPADEAGAAQIKALYQQGHEAIGVGDWSEAVQRFAELERRLHGGAGADAALYWRAYALAQAGRAAQSQELVKRLRSEHPNSRWIAEAERLQRRPAGAAAAVAGGESDQDRLETLIEQPADKSLPQLVQLLRDAKTPQAKRRVLFVLSQIDDPRAMAQIAAAAEGGDPALSAQAVHLLGVSGAETQLRQIYSKTGDAKLKQRALQALGVAGATDALADAARNSSDTQLRHGAVQGLGVSGGVDALTQIAAGDADLSTRREAIKALGVAGGQKQLLELYPKLSAV
ncbi:hypothetical protein AB4084_12905, partial [Lysobacter sp. 2RAB21]